jgi:hypothetical protein
MRIKRQLVQQGFAFMKTDLCEKLPVEVQDECLRLVSQLLQAVITCERKGRENEREDQK